MGPTRWGRPTRWGQTPKLTTMGSDPGIPAVRKYGGICPETASISSRLSIGTGGGFCKPVRLRLVTLDSSSGLQLKGRFDAKTLKGTIAIRLLSSHEQGSWENARIPRCPRSRLLLEMRGARSSRMRIFLGQLLYYDNAFSLGHTV